MSYRKWVVPLAVLTVMAVTSVSFAQRPGGRGGFGGQGNLLANPQVQEELKLTDDQKAKIREAGATLRESFAGLRDLPEDQRREKMAELREKAQAAAKEAEAVLNDDQKKRLMGISIQVQGVQALGNESVAKELGLSDDQKAKVKEALDSYATQSRELFQGARDAGNREELREKATKLRDETQAKLKEVLTDDQSKKLDELKGEPFELRRGEGGAPRRRSNQT